ncbi:MAG TPA: carboxypeptidase regulatory-like domain-containing protein [Gemmatimonadaceae bacterium]
MRRRLALAAVLCFSLVPLAAVAAQASRRGTLQVVVLTRDSAAAIPSASVNLDSATAQGTTDGTGTFIFRDVAVGEHRVSAHRLGFMPATASATVNADATTKIVLRLDPAPHVLPEVEVRGQRVIDLPRFTAAVERASRNNGAVFTADLIQKENPLDTKSLLERLPGVRVNDRGISFVRCQDNGMLRQPSRGGGGAGMGAQSVSPTRVQVYIDGLRVTKDGPVSQGAFDPDDANGILSRINPRTIAVMEVYTGIARIPAEYLADACAVVAIWTKAY